MESKQNAVQGEMQDGVENSNGDTLPGRRQSLKFSDLDSNENSIRADLKQVEPAQ
jgi:hypothetical protein